MEGVQMEFGPVQILVVGFEHGRAIPLRDA